LFGRSGRRCARRPFVKEQTARQRVARRRPRNRVARPITVEIGDQVKNEGFARQR
jgi:hypothetical protein